MAVDWDPVVVPKLQSKRTIKRQQTYCKPETDNIISQRAEWQDEEIQSLSFKIDKRLDIYKATTSFNEFAKPSKVLTKSKLTKYELTREDYLGLY